MAEGKKHWIKGAIKHPGAFSSAAEKAGKSTSAFAKEHEHDSGTLGKRARLAQTLMRMHHKKEESNKPTVKGMMHKMHGNKE